MRYSLALLLVTACGSEAGRPSQITSDSGAVTPDAAPVAPDARPASDGSTTDECASLTVEAEEQIAPVDIVWIVDNSGSMGEEASFVQNQMTSFVASIEAAGIDPHVVVISQGDFIQIDTSGERANHFLRIDEDVQSTDSLQKLLATFPRYSSFLRRQAELHFVVVTDDESAMSAESFVGQMQGLLGHTFKFHAIASPPGSRHSDSIIGSLGGCAGPHGDADGNGVQYWAAANMTGGRTFSICSVDWSPLFTELGRAIAVQQSLPCEYELPVPPSGTPLDPSRVNVRYQRGSDGVETTLPNVGAPERCGETEGWYYEGESAAPTGILLCPNACRRLDLDTGGRVDVELGCETLLI